MIRGSALVERSLVYKFVEKNGGFEFLRNGEVRLTDSRGNIAVMHVSELASILNTYERIKDEN